MKILFVCTGNTCRSPMAQGMLTQMLKEKGGQYTVDSAGIYAHPNTEITPQAEKQLKSRGILMAGRKSKRITEKQIEDADLIFTMTGNQRRLLVENYPYAADKIHLLGDFTNRGGDVTDPYGGTDSIYEETAKEIECMLKILVDMI